MRTKTARKVSRVVRCCGGPWDGQQVRLPVQSFKDPWSLRIRINFNERTGYVGRYNMNTGVWKSD